MKTVFKTISIAAFAIVSGYGVYASQHEVEMSDLAMANIEALANGEANGNHITCYSGSGSSFLCRCSTCTWQYTGTSSRGTCY